MSNMARKRRDGESGTHPFVPAIADVIAPEADSWRCRSSPVIPGICTSAIRQEVRRTWGERKNSSADAAASTRYPKDFKRPLTARASTRRRRRSKSGALLLACELPHPGCDRNDAPQSEALGRRVMLAEFQKG